MAQSDTTDPREAALDELVAQAQELKLDYQPTADSNPTTLAGWRWRLTVWLLYRALRIAPDGSASIALEDTLRDWGMMWGAYVS